MTDDDKSPFHGELVQYTAECSQCGKEYSGTLGALDHISHEGGKLRCAELGMEPPTPRPKYPRCPDCVRENDERITRERAEQKLNERRSAWERISPGYIFSQTDPARLSGDAWDTVTVWEPSIDSKGLILQGPTGRGKTRMIVYLLEKLHFSEAEWDVKYVTSHQLSAAASNLFSDDRAEKEAARELLRKCKAVDVLAIDDLGKGRLTARAESELFEIVDYRTRHGLDLIITTNATAAELEAMMSPDIGPPLMRRICEFCTPVKL